MTEAEKIVLVKALSEETDEGIISAFLSMAGDAICNYCDPFTVTNRETILARYGSTQCKAAAYYLNKRGWDFQTSHSENGIARNFESGDLPQSILREITPKAANVRSAALQEGTSEDTLEVTPENTGENAGENTGENTGGDGT